MLHRRGSSFIVEDEDDIVNCAYTAAGYTTPAPAACRRAAAACILAQREEDGAGRDRLTVGVSQRREGVDVEYGERLFGHTHVVDCSHGVIVVTRSNHQTPPLTSKRPCSAVESPGRGFHPPIRREPR